MIDSNPQIQFTSLASSSSGNAYIVDDGESKILLECGLPFGKLKKLTGFTLSEIDFCLITHEHNDHCKAVDDIIRAGIPVYTSEGTADVLRERTTIENDEINIMKSEKTVRIGSYKILPFPVFHDAAEPFGYLICSGGDRLLFATDTANIMHTFPKLGQIAVECNYDRSTMKLDKIEPWAERAMKSHMDIGKLIEYLSKLDLSGVRQIHLLHLSSRHSDENGFVERIQNTFGIPVTACAV